MARTKMRLKNYSKSVKIGNLVYFKVSGGKDVK
jgi:hypothetical protein